MRWPWSRAVSGDLCVVSWVDQTLAYVAARAQADGSFKILNMGVEAQGSDTVEAFAQRLQSKGLKGRRVHAMLRPEQYQFLQVEAPAVPPEEMRAAARYQIREMVDAHIDDITLDVLKVGDGQHKSAGLLYVVAANNAVIRGVLDLGQLLQWKFSVIDVQETAQRNLQNLTPPKPDRATAALVLSGVQHALLTISANDELFYTRRLDIPDGFMAMDWAQSAPEVAPVDGYTPVDEYVPDHAGGGDAFGGGYGTPQPATATSLGDSADNDRAQRFLVEVQRSLDLWDRTWSVLPLDGLRVAAGSRSSELARWLGREMGQSVSVLGLASRFPGFEEASASDQAYCLPLLGVFLRTEARKA
jgi:MSHA biogenesis protein MshI